MSITHKLSQLSETTMYLDVIKYTWKKRLPNGCRFMMLLALFATTPAWSDDSAFLSIGPFEQGVYDGTAPFSVSGDCTQAGDDCSNNDQRVRTNDVVQFAWSIVAGGLNDPGSALDAVILEQTITPDEGAIVEFMPIPAACLAPPAGNGGSLPESSITMNSDGSSTLICNLGSLGSGEQKSLSIAVQPKTASRNDSTFTTSQIVYGLDATGTISVPESDYSDGVDYTISAAPAYDLIGDRLTITRGEVTTADIGNGPEEGYIYQYTAHIAAASDRGALGIEPLGDSFSFNAGVFATHDDGTTPFDLNYGVLDCAPNQFEWDGTVYGNTTDNPSISDEQTVVDSGTCDISGDSTSGYTMTITGADTTSQQYPTSTLDGTSLASGPYFVAAYSLQIFVPFSEIDRADGTIGNEIGQLQLGACLSDFDPQSSTGVSNYLDGLEPGFNGSAMPNGGASNNCAGITSAQLNTEGEFSFRALSAENDQGTLTQYAPLISSYHSGDGVAEPGQSYGTLLFYRNNGSEPLSGFNACTVFDNTVQTITDRSSIGATAGTFAYEGEDTVADYDPTQWKIEYGVALVSGDNPLDGNNDGNADFNAVTGRYDGSWSRLQKLRCDSPTIDWHDDLSSVDSSTINAVRFSSVSPGTLLAPGQEVRLITPLRLRTHFSGGPQAGSLIPSGTVAAAYGSYRSNERNSDWNINSYVPAPENTSADGDRITIARAVIDVALSTSEPQASAGVVETVLAGNQIIWTAHPVVRSDNFIGDLIRDITLTVELSEGSSYNNSCTLTTPGGLAPDSIEADSEQPGITRLTWTLGDASANTDFTPIDICVDTDAFLDAGSAVHASALLSADNTVSSKSRSQSVSLGQAGAILTDVIVGNSLSVADADQDYTLQWTNFSAAATIDKPVMINVFPFNGDSEGGSARQPASNFNGTFSIKAEPVATFRNGTTPSNSEPSIGTFFYTGDASTSVIHNPAENNSNWCTYSGTEFVSDTSADCPASWNEVTALKFESNYDLAHRGSDRDSVQINYTASTSGNSAGDTYTNVFGVDSTSLPADQYLVSRRGSVNIVSFTISGTVFAAIDGDLDYDAGIDPLVPDGVLIELISTTDNSTVSSVTTEGGNYHFSNLLPGEYFVLVPASVLDPAGDLPGWTAAATGDSAQNIINTEFGDPSTVGIATFPINVGVSTDNTARPNPTVNLALTPNDADSDGIDDIIEYGENAFIVDSLDTDGDGIADYIDSDSDGDSIPDATEGNTDIDGDGIANYVDTDSDGDGNPDAAEGDSDSDGDGIPDYLDSNDNNDLDGDGIADSIEGTTDTDGDGIPNREDTDSDADGIPDSVEHNTDTDGDGTANYIDTDSDADGIPDSIEGTDDLNANGVPDYIDNQIDPDSDGDGIPDIFEGVDDLDGDGIGNSGDTDSDGDTIPDNIETSQDTDGDGIPNYKDLDSDNDSIPDRIETARDSDSDEIADFRDLDSDNDALTDIQESSNSNRDGNGDGLIDNVTDMNTDGIDDAISNSGEFIIDTDYDGVADFRDLDSDNDGIPDIIETLGSSVDQNRDGHLDVFVDENNDGLDEQSEIAMIFVTDSDEDGIPNALDLDSDGDTRSDVRESGGEDANGDFIIDPMGDVDRDAVQDMADADNTGGSDADADGIDDSSDTSFTSGTDTDGDGIIDVNDPDANGDGYIDPAFHDPALGNPYPDFDGNGTPDFQQSLTGVVTSGVGGEGIGCAIGKTGRIDPTFLLLLLISIFYLACFRSRTRSQN